MDLNAYFKTLAEQHVDILHNDDEENKGYFRSFSSSVVLLDNNFHANLRFAKANVLISQFNQDGQIPIPADDFPRPNPDGTLYILSKIIDGYVEAARVKAIEIRDDIVARIKVEMRNNTLAKNFMVESMQSQSIGRIANDYYSIAMFISYTERDTTVYNSEKWILVS